MSIYDTSYPNRLDIRTRSTMTDELLVWNAITQKYEHVTAGGDGEPVALPYYLQNDSIQFTGARGINGAFVNDVDQIQNSILPAHEGALEELDGRVDANTLAVDNLMPRMTAVEGVNTTQGTKITALETKTANITQTGSTSLGMGYASTVSNRAQLNSIGLVVYSGAPALNPTGNVQRVSVKPDSIEFTTSTGGSVYLDVNRIDTLAKLTSVTTSDFNDKLNLTKGVTFPGGVETTDTSNKKMVVMDATTKALSYTSIPSGATSTRKVLYHVPLVGSNLFRATAYDFSNNTAPFDSDPANVRKYPVEGVDKVILDLKEVGTAFDIHPQSFRSEALLFFKDDAVYNPTNGTIISEKLNLTIDYLPHKDDHHSNFITVRIKPLPVWKNYPVSGDQWAMGRLIMVERVETSGQANTQITLRGKFVITNHVVTGGFGELNYGWLE